MGVVAIACVAVVSAPMLGPMGRLHHGYEQLLANNRHGATMSVAIYGAGDGDEAPILTLAKALGAAGVGGVSLPKYGTEAQDDAIVAPTAPIGFGRPTSGFGAVARASAPAAEAPAKAAAPPDPPPPPPNPRAPGAPWVEAPTSTPPPVTPDPPVVPNPPVVVVTPVVVIVPPVSPPPPPIIEAPPVRLAAVPVAPAPEPATWGMMVLGFAAIGAAFRRRRGRTGVVPRAGRPAAG